LRAGARLFTGVAHACETSSPRSRHAMEASISASRPRNGQYYVGIERQVALHPQTLLAYD